MKVAILGSGPAGLLAAHAVSMGGHTPVIISKKVKSKISGAQFIHRPIEGATRADEMFYIRFDMVGTGIGYTSRLYKGHEVPVLSSWHSYKDGQTMQAWPIDAMYDRLWDYYEGSINDMDIDWLTTDEIVRSHEWVVSTVPRWALDIGNPEGPGHNEWAYESREVWIRPWGPAEALDDNVVMYNGTSPGADDNTMYRMSKIRGSASAEFTQEVAGGVKIVKPIRFTGTDTWPQIFKVGRYGAWSKMQLAHHAYSAVLDQLVPQGH